MSQRYPLSALPDEIQDLIDEESGGPVGNTILAAAIDTCIAAASSSIVRCVLPDGRKMPCTVFSFVEGDPGTGKSKYIQIAAEPTVSWDKCQKEKEGIDINQHQAAETVWNSKIRALTRQIDKCVEAGDSTEDLEAQLATAYSERPKAPSDQPRLIDDTTIPALLRTLAVRHAAILMPDEGGTMLLSMLPRDFNTLAALWSGKPIQINRVGEAPLSASGQLSLMCPVQPEIHRAANKKSGHFFKSSGLGARFQYYIIPSGQPDPTHFRVANTGQAFGRYRGRIHAMLDESLHVKEIDDLYEITFSPRAARALGCIVDGYRTDMLDQRNAHCVDYLAKMGDHIARWAARYHAYLGLKGSIQPEMVERGDAIMRYHLKTSDQLHMPRRRSNTSRESAWRRDAKALHGWLLDHPGGFYHSEIGQIAMALGMPYTSRVRRAICRLEDYDLIRIDERRNDLLIRAKRSFLDIDYD
ncbi:DUF3987 domain-containing protein [Castellaniella defragrans]|uniref:DUF3987 domain-containing protein n=1 Tax=Castellaniella defragrans TaxID=75697 RepID=UPI002AFFCD5A|nr:DUF3987 domain-containing protein [Castellaniella defragrans]